jgi:hypothetical protein
MPDPLFSDATRFRKIVGALQYLTFTHPVAPDIAAAHKYFLNMEKEKISGICFF